MAPSMKAVVKSSWGRVSSALSSRRKSKAGASAGTETEPSRKAPTPKKVNKLTEMTFQPPTPLRRRREDFGFPPLGSELDREWEQEIFSKNPQDYRRTPGHPHFAPFVHFFPNPPYPDTDDEFDDGTPSTTAVAHAPATETIAISVFVEEIPDQVPKPAPTQPSDPLRFYDDYLTSRGFGPVPQVHGPLPAPTPYEISHDEARLSSAPYTPLSFEEQRLFSSPYTPFGACRSFPLHTVSRRLIVEELNKDSFLPDAPDLGEDASDTSSPLPRPQVKRHSSFTNNPSATAASATSAASATFASCAATAAEFEEDDDQDIDLPDAPPLEYEEPSSPPQTPIRQITQPLFVQTPAPLHPPFLPPSSEPSTSEPVTPVPAPADALSPVPDNPGDEHRIFTYRRTIEGDKFAHDLFKSIRNDHYMRQCRCGLPTIFDSKAAAETGTGHLRFYVLDGNTLRLTDDNLRVIQKKTDLKWHCSCQQPKKLDLVYHKHIYNRDNIFTRKRPAEESEVELRAQIAEEEPRAQTAGEESMWEFVTDRAATMTATIKSFLGSWCPKFISDHIETIQSRQGATASTGSAQATDAGSEIVVKRFKRQHALPLGTAPAVDLSKIPGLRWASDPRRYIGEENILAIYSLYLQEYNDIMEGKFCGASSTPHLWMMLNDERHTGQHNAIASINMHRTMEDMYGCVAFDEDNVRREKWEAARDDYAKKLITLLGFIEEVYLKGDEFASAKSRYPQPPTGRRLGRVEFTQTTGAAARFITWLLHGKDAWVVMSNHMLDTLAKMVADADALHKHEMVPSWVEYPGHNDGAASAPTGITAPTVLWDEVPIDQFKAEAGHEVRFPTSMYPPTPARREMPNVIENSPAPILKRRQVAFPEHAASPRYVGTPMKNRKISFVSPVVKLARNIHQPARVLKASERKRLGKQGVKKAEDAYQLRDLHLKYDNFLKTLEENVDLQKEFRQALASRNAQYTMRATPKPGIPSKIAQPTSGDREAKLKRDQEMRRVFNLKRDLSSKLTALKENPVLSPETKRKAIEEPLPDTPEDRRKFLEENPVDPIPFKPTSKPGIRRPANINLAKEALRAAHAARTSKEAPKPATTTQERRQLIDAVVEAKSDVADQLAEDMAATMDISSKKQEDLELTRHLKSEVEDSVTREINAAKKREAEEKARIAAEAEAARLRAELAAAGGLRNPTARLISPLSQEWVQKVSALSHANPKANLAQTPEGQALERRDFVDMLLPSTAWLNDNIIIGSVLHAAAAVNQAAAAPAQDPKCAAFTSFFYGRLKSHGPTGVARIMRMANVRKTNFLNIETILIPICQDSHWTLAVVRPRDGIVAHIDSMKAGRGDKAVEDRIMDWVRVTLGDDFKAENWRVHQYRAPRQTNGWDCGVFTITNAVCLALGVKMEGAYDPKQLTLQRSRIAAMLLNGGWKGDFALDGF